jgi:hypothetical protein
MHTITLPILRRRWRVRPSIRGDHKGRNVMDDEVMNDMQVACIAVPSVVPNER